MMSQDPAPNGRMPTRFEYKYLVPVGVSGLIRSFKSPFVVPDPYAKDKPGHRYTICSLYLDTPDLRMYRQTVEGNKNRFKLRVRSYSDDPATPVFAEIKRKVDSAVLKQRAMLDREQAHTLLGGHSLSWRGRENSQRAAAESFQDLMLNSGARPVVRVRYEREAWVAADGGPVRVTFDTRLCCRRTPGPDLALENGHFSPVALAAVILEIKFTGQFPTWLRDMAMMFELRRRSVPKYILSVDTTVRTAVPPSFARGAAIGFGMP